jgi:hypothetical protein
LAKRLIQLLALSICVLLISTAAYSGNLKKEDFEKLQGMNRMFYFVALEFAYNTDDFKYSFNDELKEIIENLDGKLVEAVPVEKLKQSIAEKFNLQINTIAFNMKFQDRKDNGFFNKKTISSNFTYHKWQVPSRKNRLVVSVYVFKAGERIRINKVQIEIRFLVLNQEKTAYETLLYSSDDKSWKDPQDLYDTIGEMCIIQ